MEQQTISDKQLEAMIRLDGAHENDALTYIYQVFRPSIMVVLKKLTRSASVDVADDAWQDGILAFLKEVRKGKWKGAGNLKAYLRGICINKAIDKMREHPSTAPLPDGLPAPDAPDGGEEPSVTSSTDCNTDKPPADQNTINNLLERLGLQGALVIFLWSRGYRYPEIAQKCGYKNPETAKTARGKFWKRLNDLSPMTAPDSSSGPRKTPAVTIHQ